MRARVAVAMLAVVLGLGGAAVAPVAAGAADGHQITVTPSTNLTDGQTVTVSGSGFVGVPLGGSWGVNICRGVVNGSPLTVEAIATNCDLATSATVSADESGTFRTSYGVHKTFTAYSGENVTCGDAPNDCAILVAGFIGSDLVGATAPISFGGPTVHSCVQAFLAERGTPSVQRARDLRSCLRSVTHPAVPARRHG